MLTERIHDRFPYKYVPEPGVEPGTSRYKVKCTINCVNVAWLLSMKVYSHPLTVLSASIRTTVSLRHAELHKFCVMFDE